MAGENERRELRVSIIEDDSEIRAHLADLIGSANGYSLVSDHPAAEAATPIILRDEPDVVLMDLNLPGMSGQVFSPAAKIMA